MRSIYNHITTVTCSNSNMKHTRILEPLEIQFLTCCQNHRKKGTKEEKTKCMSHKCINSAVQCGTKTSSVDQQTYPLIRDISRRLPYGRKLDLQCQTPRSVRGCCNSTSSPRLKFPKIKDKRCKIKKHHAQAKYPMIDLPPMLTIYKKENRK